MSFHDNLKWHLVKIGKEAVDSSGNPYFSRSYSGDSEPLDVRRGMNSIEWLPDVIWDRRGKKFVIEIALNEDWRQIIGEFTLASIYNCWGILFIIRGFQENFFNNLMGILEQGLNYKDWFSYTIEKTNIEFVSNDIADWLSGAKMTGWKR